MSGSQNRRDVLKLGGLGAAAGVLAGLGAGAASLLSPAQAYAQAAPTSLLRTVLDRKKLIVGTGSTNAPWHFEDEKGPARRAWTSPWRASWPGPVRRSHQGGVRQAGSGGAHPEHHHGQGGHRHPVHDDDSPGRAQLVAFSRPYYVEGVALLTSPKGKFKTFKQLVAAGKAAKASVLQNVYADKMVTRRPAPGAGHAARHPGERHPGAGLGPGGCGGGRPLHGALAGQAQPESVCRRGLQLLAAALRRGGAPGRPRLAALGQHRVHRGHVRPPERSLRQGARGLLRAEAAGPEAGLPAHSRPRGLRIPADRLGLDETYHLEFRLHLAALRQADVGAGAEPRAGLRLDPDRDGDRAQPGPGLYRRRARSSAAPSPGTSSSSGTSRCSCWCTWSSTASRASGGFAYDATTSFVITLSVYAGRLPWSRCSAPAWRPCPGG